MILLCTDPAFLCLKFKAIRGEARTNALSGIFSLDPNITQYFRIPNLLYITSTQVYDVNYCFNLLDAKGDKEWKRLCKHSKPALHNRFFSRNCKSTVYKWLDQLLPVHVIGHKLTGCRGCRTSVHSQVCYTLHPQAFSFSSDNSGTERRKQGFLQCNCYGLVPFPIWNRVAWIELFDYILLFHIWYVHSSSSFLECTICIYLPVVV